MAKTYIKGAVLSLLMATVLLLPAESTAERYGKYDRKAALSLTARQIALYDAKIKSDWEAIYKCFSPDIRSKISLKNFVAQPHLFKGVPNVPANDENISENKKTESGDAVSGKKEFIPRYASFRIERIHLSNDKNHAKIYSRVTIPIQALGVGASIDLPDEEYWRKIDGNWYLEWDLKYVAKLSGATTKKDTLIPKFTQTILNKELSLWYLEQADKLSAPSVRYDLLERALLLDPYAAIEKINEMDIDAGDLPARYIDRAMFGRKTSSMFTSKLEMGYWYKLAGENKKSYESYLEAHKRDKIRIDALEGLVQSAYDSGNFSAAVEHYSSLLIVTYAFKLKPKETIERYLMDGCSLCGKTGSSARLELARNAVYSKNYDIAYSIYSYSLKSRVGWSAILNRVSSGEKIKLKDVLGDEVAGELIHLTYDDISALLKLAGVKLYHPGEELVAEGLENGIFLNSLPKRIYATYKGGFNTTTNPALAIIRSAKEISYSDNVKGGYVAMLEENGEFNVDWFPDDHEMFAGNKELLARLEKMKNGNHAYLARHSVGKNTLIDYWEKGIRNLGIDKSLLPTSPSSHVIALKKGGMSRVLEGEMNVTMNLTLSNLDEWDKKNSPSLKITGIGSDDKLIYSH